MNCGELALHAVAADPILQWELGRLADTGLLEPGEIVCEVESVWTRVSWGRGRSGALLLTDRRLLFVSTSVSTRRTHIEEIDLATVEAVDVFESAFWGRDRARISVMHGDSTRQPEFDKIRGGRARAEEIRSSILHQRALLLRSADDREEPTGTKQREATVETPGRLEPSSASLEITVGRGVASYVRGRGGVLYLWSEPSGRAFVRLKAHTEPPAGTDLEPFLRSRTSTCALDATS